MTVPHPEHEIARRITELEMSRFPDVMVWNPLHSASGCWEAAGDDWQIIEADPAVFSDRLEQELRKDGR